jgi:hypothetical protein
MEILYQAFDDKQGYILFPLNLFAAEYIRGKFKIFTCFHGILATNIIYLK